MPVSSSLPRSIPEAQGISSAAIADFVVTAEKTVHHMHSYMLVRHGHVVAEGWWYPWRADAPHMMFSLSKSFTATAVGLAIAEGRLTIDDQVLSFFPNEVPRKTSDNLAEMTVRHLLTMTTGHDRDTFEDMMCSHSPIKTFLSRPVVHTPGTHFLYDTGATFTLSAILQKLTGETLVDYLTPRLFEPLGISSATWESHPVGINYGGMGLNITTEEIARFGLLYLQKGQWNGRRILPEGWVEEATCRQVSNGADPESDWTQGYGYQFWRCRNNFYRADGAFGQFCIVMAEKQAVLAITSGVEDMQAVLNLVWERLLPAMDNYPVPAGEEEHNALIYTLANLRLAPPPGERTSPIAQSVSGKAYTFERNYETLFSIGFDFNGEGGKMTYRLLGGGKRRGIHELDIGYSQWREGVSYLGGRTPQKVAVSGMWTAQDTYTVTMCYYETPFILTLTCRFEGNRLIYGCRANVAFGPLEHPQLVGSAALPR